MISSVCEFVERRGKAKFNVAVWCECGDLVGTIIDGVDVPKEVKCVCGYGIDGAVGAWGDEGDVIGVDGDKNG